MALVRDENDGGARAKYEDLCLKLNMDKETEETAWKKFTEVSQRFSLEGDTIHWFCCALYAACRESYTPTVGGSNAVVMGNCVSLNNLLRSCNMSISQFISKIKTWHEMANLSVGFLNQIKKLERTFSITFHLFQRYNDIFEQIFLAPPNEKKNTKFRSVAKCSSNKLYDICWCLYLCAKNEKPDFTVDIVTSFHLLICCIDLIYINVLSENRVDLINTEFEGVPEKWNTPDFDTDAISTHCIIGPLARLAQAIQDHAKTMKDNSWKDIISKFFSTKTICGNENSFLGVVSNRNFEQNLKSLNSAYEQYVLSVGEFDERIFLNNPNSKTQKTDTFESGKVDHQQEIKCLIPDTPYTRKNCLPSKDAVSEPVANATNNVKKLLAIAHISEPTEFIRRADENVLNQINEMLCCMSNVFHTKFPNKAEVTKRFQLAKSLYYYLLDKIIRVEIRTKQNIDLKVLLDNNTFNTTLIACCVEIVLGAYNSQLKFPWILDCFSINAFHFYKIIEIVVGRHDGILTRALIKHLNFIEETCLESLAWKKSSLVWEIMKADEQEPLPTWSEVDVDNISKRIAPQLQSPMNSAYDTFSSTAVSSDSARRDLFNTAKELTLNEKSIDISTKQSKTINRRAGSLSIFLRKFYKLAWLRIEKLCVDLGMGNELWLNKIWTLFEHSITQRKDLMQDRHLDQLLMCAIYLYIKVCGIEDQTFKNIMQCYRNQPQATSNTYRQVLIGSSNSNQSTNGEDKEPTHNDIIFFYNNIYVPKMTPYALDFSEKKKKSQNDLLLSPHPTEKPNLPLKLSHNHLLYVHPMGKNEVLHSPNDITYFVGRSPAKDLEKINEIVRRGSKRNLPFNEDSSANDNKLSKKTPFLFETITGIIKDRQEDRN